MSAPAMTRRRLFVASWPDEATRSAAMCVSRDVLSLAGGRPVDAGGLHVTLVFLGSVEAGGVDEIVAALGTVRAAAFDYRFDTLESWRGPRVLALTQREAPAAAQRLVGHLWTVLQPLGFVSETRPHRPHVTLARKVAAPAIRQPIPPLVWPVRDIFLVESQGSPDGSVYTPIFAHDLKR